MECIIMCLTVNFHVEGVETILITCFFFVQIYLLKIF